MASIECELTTIPVEWCAHCLGHADPVKEKPTTVPEWEWLDG